jgi:peptidoglycan/LPS O-acetylase OafA/YrhL
MKTRPRLAQIDLLKGLAVLSVIALHGLTAEELHDAWSPFHFGQAVPVFLVVMGMNGASSFRDRRAAAPRELLSPSYFAGRFDRLVMPFAVVWLASLAVGAVHGGLHFGPLLAVGVTPLSGPGNYFVTIAFEFVLVFPLLFWAFVRAPLATVLGCFALDAAFELAAPSLFSGAFPYGYDAAIPRYLGQIAIGLWIADHPAPGARANRWIVWLAPLSVAYLVLQRFEPDAFSWLRDDFGTTTNFLAAPFAGALVLAGLRFLPRRAARAPVAVVAALGRASWHVFLVQMVWFAAVGDRGLDVLPLHVLGSCAIGYTLFHAMSRSRLAAPIGAIPRRAPG